MFERIIKSIKKSVEDYEGKGKIDFQKSDPFDYYRKKFEGNKDNAILYIKNKTIDFFNLNEEFLKEDTIGIFIDKKTNLLKEIKDIKDELNSIDLVFELNITKNLFPNTEINSNIKDHHQGALNVVKHIDNLEENSLEHLSLKLTDYINKLEKDLIKDREIDKRIQEVKEENRMNNIEVFYKDKDNKIEKIEINFNEKLQEFKDFYEEINLDTEVNFEDEIREIWEENREEIQEEIEKHGYNRILFIPATKDLNILKDKTSMENGYHLSDNFKEGGEFTNAKSENIDKPRIVLTYNTQNLKDREETKETLNTKGKDVPLDKTLTLEDYLIFARKYFKETGKHLDKDGWTWLATKSGDCLVVSGWNFYNEERLVHAVFFYGRSSAPLGFRPSRSFYKK